MKHLIPLLLLALLMPATATAYSFKVDGIYYNIIGNEASVTYQLFKYEDGDGYVSDCSGNIVIPATVTYCGTTYAVTSIGKAAFSRSRVTSISIPNSVTSIGDFAFEGCSGLTSMNIPNSVTSIGDGAFYDCNNLTNINIPNSVTTIGEFAFKGCNCLTNIPNSVTAIGRDAFVGTAWYENQPNGLIYVGKVAYKYKGTMPEGTSIVLEDGTLHISGSAFNGCGGLTSISIPNSVTSIGYGAFSGCSGLTSISIPNSVTSIGCGAFSGCRSLTNITIPNSISAIGSDAFDGTTWYENQPNGLVYVGPVAYKYKGTMPSGSGITLRDGTVSISDLAFAECNGLINVTIPNSVTSIGESAFAGCTGLTSMTIPNSVTSIGGRAFKKCSGLTSVDIPNSVNSIGDGAFERCSGLSNITIPNSVTTIGFEVFAGCSGLTGVTIPNSVNSIGEYAFWGCSSLTNITIPNSVTSIGDNTFCRCSSLTNITIPSSVTSIGYEVFQECTGLTSVIIPNSVTSIGYWAFCGCSRLTSIYIPNSVTSIGDWAFWGCSGLTSITVENNNPTYDSRDNCNAIIETSSNILMWGCINTVIPNSVTSIGYNAFSGCTGLTSINIPNSVTSIGGSAFSGCTGLTSIYIPNSVTSISYSAFSGCTGLTSVTIPNSVTSIGYSAFYGCTGLDTVYSYISDPSLVSIGNNAFYRYPNNYTTRILYVPYGTSGAYQSINNWSRYFGNIVEMDMEPDPDEHNYLTINDITVRRGETVVIPVAMTNEASITSFQTDIFLPEGIELLQEDGEYLIDPSSRMTRTHSIISEATDNDAIHVLCYSPSSKAFTGNSGEDLFYMTLKVADDAEGDYTIALRNTRLTTTESEELLTPDAEANVKVKANEPGDVKEDGMINVADVSALIQYLLTGNSSLINLDNADVNGDGLVIINDISALISMLLAPGR